MVEEFFQFTENNEIFINFIIKELIRSYGSPSVNYVMNNQKLNRMTPKHLIGDDEVNFK